jgi:hypothetical protein
MVAQGFRPRERCPRKILVTDRAVAKRLRVSLRMIRLWINTGAWPLPLSADGASLLFDLADVEGWLKTGAWPAGVHFRSRAPALRKAGHRTCTRRRSAACPPTAVGSRSAATTVPLEGSHHSSQPQPSDEEFIASCSTPG